jgi:hypothetical protein
MKVADLDGPAQPTSICLDAQLKSYKRRQPTGSFRIEKFAHSDAAL